MDTESLRIRRRAADITIEQLAESIGVQASTLSRWERGRRPHAVMLKAWIESLDELERTASTAAEAASQGHPEAKP